MAQGYIWASPLAKAMLGGVVLVSSAAFAQDPVKTSGAPVKGEPASSQGGAIIMNASGSTPEAVAKQAGVKVQKVGQTNYQMNTDKMAPKTVDTMQVIPTALVEPEVARAAVEKYFNGLDTLQADFSQSVSGQDFGSEGTFSFQRPRKFVFQYDTPTKQKIVSTGTAAYYVDQSGAGGKDGQVTQLPMGAGLGRIFGAKSLNLKSEGLHVVQATQTTGVLRVLVGVDKMPKGDDQAGLKQVWLVFERMPGEKLQLSKVEALDTLGATTTVTFANVKEGVKLPASLFEYTPGVYKNRN